MTTPRRPNLRAGPRHTDLGLSPEDRLFAAIVAQALKDRARGSQEQRAAALVFFHERGLAALEAAYTTRRQPHGHTES